MAGPVSDYITRLEQQLRQRGIVDPRILAESREHLVDAIEEGRGRGLSAADAEHEALERFGAPEIVAAHVLEERERVKMGFAGVFATMWHHKWWILMPTVLAAVVTSLTSGYFQPVRYRSQTTILVVPQRVPDDYVRSAVVAKLEEQLRSINLQIRSRTRLERIIEDFNLYSDRRKKDTMQEIVDEMSNAIDVEILNGGDVFRVAFTSDNARTAMQVTDRLAAEFVDEHLKQRMTLAEGTSVFLESEVADTARKPRETEQTIAEYKLRHDGDSTRDTELTELARDYATLRSQFDNLSAKQLQAELAADLERRQIGEQFRILDAANLPERPVGPSRIRVAIIGALVGLAIGLVLVVLRRSSNTNTRPPALAEA